jgi:hypothetical protein
VRRINRHGGGDKSSTCLLMQATPSVALSRTAGGPRAVREPVHVRNLHAREKGGPAHARRGDHRAGRSGKAKAVSLFGTTASTPTPHATPLGAVSHGVCMVPEGVTFHFSDPRTTRSGLLYDLRSGACHRSDADRYNDKSAARHLTTMRTFLAYEPANFKLPP